MGDFPEAPPVRHQARVRFGPALDRARLATPRSVGNQIRRQAAQQFRDDHLNPIAEPLAKSLAHSGLEYLELVSAALLERVGPRRQAVAVTTPAADCAGCHFGEGED